MMEDLHETNPKSWTYKQFQNVNRAPEKTFNTIVATSIAKQKTAVFVEASDSDRTMNMLINHVLYASNESVMYIR